MSADRKLKIQQVGINDIKYIFFSDDKIYVFSNKATL